MPDDEEPHPCATGDKNLWCVVCSNVEDMSECREKGKFDYCGKNHKCEWEQLENGRYDRYCTPISECSVSGGCGFGEPGTDFKCMVAPDDPCASHENGTELSCLTCYDKADLDVCREEGTMDWCGEDHICHEEWEDDGYFSRCCARRDTCVNSASVTCDYGEDDKDYTCGGPATTTPKPLSTENVSTLEAPLSTEKVTALEGEE